MRGDKLDSMVDRKQKGEEGLGPAILERIAENVYKSPRLYGFKSEDEVGEVFSRYWTRIERLADKYVDIGCGFEAFLIASMRYMALSIRRQRAYSYDREGAFTEDVKAEARSAMEREGNARYVSTRAGIASAFPRPDDHGISAVAFRRRMLFLCVKCANVLGDDEAREIARLVGLDERELLGSLALARSRGLGLRKRTASRRRGRDAAWLRMGAAGRRLAREADEETRRYLSASIERDRGLYTRAVRLIAKASPILSNKSVAELLGVPKGTVDCGVGRLLRQHRALYAEVDDE